MLLRNIRSFLTETSGMNGVRFGKQRRETQTKNQSSVTLDAKDLLVGAGHWLSEQERRVDALALRAEERRDKLRKAAGSCT